MIGLAALAFTVGTITAFSHRAFLLEPVGFWRGAIGFLLFAIARADGIAAVKRALAIAALGSARRCRAALAEPRTRR